MIDRALTDALKTRLRGAIILPGDGGYDECRAGWNGMIDKKPGVILRCSGVADIVQGIAFAREHQLPLAVRGGGHNIAGLGTCNDGVVLDLSLMRGVWVDPATKRAQAQAGCLLGDVDRETQLHGLAAVLGFVSNTGIAGLTLGGGFGYLTPRFGWTCDTVESMNLVTADGRLVRASAQENPDLFWGLRGGGGNFGVVTSFEYRLYPVGPDIIGGAVAWRAEDAPAVMEMHRTFMAGAPPECACVLVMRLAPPAPWLPKEIHGKPIVALFVCDTGPLAEAEQRVAPIKAFGKPVGDILQRRPYTVQQTLLDAANPKGRRYYWKSEYLPAIGDDMGAVFREHATRISSPHSAMVLFPLGGALNALPAAYSPVGNRDARWVLNIPASWERAEDDAAQIEWARSAWRDLKAFSTGGTYVNFLTEEEGADRIRAAYGINHARLVETKKKWDPDNVFSITKNFAPTSAGR